MIFFQHYLLFEKFVAQQFNAVIKPVQCDGGGEFINQYFFISSSLQWNSITGLMPNNTTAK